MIFNDLNSLQVIEATIITIIDHSSPLSKRSLEPSSSNLPRTVRFQRRDMILYVQSTPSERHILVLYFGTV